MGVRSMKFSIFKHRPKHLSEAIREDRQRQIDSTEANRRMLVDACRTLPAAEKLALIYAEISISPDVTPQMAESYGKSLTRLSWKLEREAAN